MSEDIVTFRLADSADAEGIWAVRADAIRCGCRDHYPPDLIGQWASAPMPASLPTRIEDDKFIVALSDSRIVGFAGLKRADREVDAVFVAPEFSGRGIGSNLLRRVEEQAVESGIAVLSLDASLNAADFYEAAGYRRIGDGRHATSSNLMIACIRMEKALGGRPFVRRDAGSGYSRT